MTVQPKRGLCERTGDGFGCSGNHSSLPTAAGADRGLGNPASIVPKHCLGCEQEEAEQQESKRWKFTGESQCS